MTNYRFPLLIDSEPLDANRTQHTLETLEDVEVGSLTAVHYADSGVFHITELETYRVSRNVGEVLLRASIDYANELDAQFIAAPISNSMDLLSMQKVFGVAFITRTDRSARNDTDGMRAFLYKPLKPSF